MASRLTPAASARSCCVRPLAFRATGLLPQCAIENFRDFLVAVYLLFGQRSSGLHKRVAENQMPAGARAFASPPLDGDFFVSP